MASTAGEKLAALFCGRPSQVRSSSYLLAMHCVAYLDDTGGRDTKWIMMAGYVAQAASWESFSDEWQAALNGEPALTRWHTKEAARRTGEYAGWTWKQVDDRLKKLVDLIREAVVCQVTVAFRTKDYLAEVAGRIPSRFDLPHLLAAVVACQDLLDQRDRFGIETLDVIVDHNEQWGPKFPVQVEELRELLSEEEREFIGLAIHAPKDRLARRFLPLQAADALAWHQQRIGRTPTYEEVARWHRWLELILDEERRVSRRVGPEDLAAAVRAGYEAGP